jgi:hypothetical protein
MTTAWATLFRRGRLSMTRPTVVYFGPDGGGRTAKPSPKVYLRTLLFSTGKRGSVVEHIFVRLRRNESAQNFSIWVYGDSKLRRGSGLFVSDAGISTDHHFLCPEDGTDFEFREGQYTLEVWVNVLGSGSSRLLWSGDFTVSEDVADQIRNSNAGAYFDWAPDSKVYLSHARTHTDTMPDFVKRMMEHSEA